MLKLIGGVVASVTIMTGAYVPPAYAASAPIVITQIQAGGSGAALYETVHLYNNSAEEVDITGWCLANKTSVKFACFTDETDESLRFFLPPYSYATVGSTALAAYLNEDGFSLTYESTNHSSGALVGSSETVSLLDADGAVRDRHTWATTLVGGMIYQRGESDGTPLTYLDTDRPSDWRVEPAHFMPDNQVERRFVDQGPEPEPEPEPEEPLPLPLMITELLPNAAGSDTGQEFIELYNPHDQELRLSQYQLWVGPAFEKSFSLPDEVLAAGQYRVVTNAEIAFSLLNTSSRVKLTLLDGRVIDETPAYSEPKEGESWGVLNATWIYTDQPTPGSPNLPMTEEADETEAEEGASSTLKPCAANQYRSPDTNRCRNIAAESSEPTPCKAGQERNPETNRCRNIVVATEPAPCKEGQERNPESNRCRNIVKMSEADYGVLGAETVAGQPNWQVWLVISALILAALGYAAWEWRYELRKIAQKAWSFVRGRFAPYTKNHDENHGS
jgi:hypothetical protein